MNATPVPLHQPTIVSVVQIFDLCRNEEGNQKLPIRNETGSDPTKMTMLKTRTNTTTNTMATALIVMMMMMLLALGGFVHAQPPEEKIVVRENSVLWQHWADRLCTTLCLLPSC